MCPMLFLLVAVLNSEFTVSSYENSTGLKFTIAFPENIAFFHPVSAQNKVKVTALYDSTHVIIRAYDTQVSTLDLNAGETKEYEANAGLELQRSNITTKSLQIISTNMITVHVINLKNNSMQTSVVTPVDKLGTDYLIPPVPEIKGTTYPPDQVTTSVTERSLFQLVIVNTEQDNTVTVEGGVTTDIFLKPHEVAQVRLSGEEALRAVKADLPVVVLFGHTCAIKQNCTCGQLYTMLPPAMDEELKFYVPPVLAKDAEGETFILLSEKDSTRVKAFDPKSPLVKATGAAVLYRPGLLLTLIPEIDFAACYVINSIVDAENFAVIVVKKDATDGIHIGSLPLDNPEWQELEGTDYVSTQVVLSLLKNVIWHTSSKMAVYFVGLKNGGLFGNPAPIISKSPDFRGCAVSPEVVKIGEVAVGWQESLKYCKDNNLELVSFPVAPFQRQVYQKIIQVKNDSQQEVWIGMRRSAQTGEWYWLSKEPVNDTNWADGEPGSVQDGQCVIMSLENSEDFGWSDESCCRPAHPVCYSRPVLLPL